jgi:hypothetical protein
MGERMNQNYFDFQLEAFKKKYPEFSGLQDYNVFVLFCAKYFFFSEVGAPFDQDLALTYLTDGKGDGGIDAIFNDPLSIGNDLIIIQSKYYGDNTKITSEEVVGELYKINETVKNLKSNKVSGYNERVITAYRNATSQMEDDGEVRVYFFTSYKPSDKRSRNKMIKSISGYFKDFDDIALNFKDDIEAQVEMCDNGKLCVEYDKLLIDKEGNKLEYEDSAILNISAKSLQNLQNRRRNGLLGLNLRYFTRSKKVDTDIENTISLDPNNFWYRNNGILIVCEDYELKGKELELKNFSIVNGGQTTTLIGKLDIPDSDFFIQCKVVKIKGSNQDSRDKFIGDIAEATNSQKPIKEADLRANSPEQLNLKMRLNTRGVYYITKKGDKATKYYPEPYQVATLEIIGKLCLSGVLQMPGSARSNSRRMYKDEYYYPMFNKEAKDGVIADLLKIGYYYESFVKTEMKNKGFDETTTLPIIKNGKTFMLACITLLAKLNNNVFTYETISINLSNSDSLKVVLKNMDGMDKIILNKLSEEKDIFFEIFTIIGEEVLGYCFSNALEVAKENQKALAASDYVKSDNNYYRDIIKRLWARYNQNKQLHEYINKITVKL